MANCVNHPWTETGAGCARCAQSFCDACLVEFLGERLCGPCRDVRLAEAQGVQRVTPIYAGTGTVALGRWLAAGWGIVMADLVTWVLAAILLTIVTSCSCYLLSGPILCGAFMMAYRKMSYGYVAVDNLFDGFRRFLWSFLATLMIGAVYMIFYLAVYGFEIWSIFQAQYDPSSLVQVYRSFGSAAAVGLFGGVLWGASFFVLPDIAARNSNPIEAFSASWSVFRRNPLMFLLAGITLSIIYVLSSFGIYLCFLGPLFGWPLILAANARAYADHFPIEGFDRI
jgi:hypothetical protein